MRRYVTPKMMRPVVIELRIVDCGLRIRGTGPGPSNPQSEIRNSQSSYLPIREQHAAPRVRLAVAFVGHPEVGPADPIAAGDEAAERVVQARLAAHRHAPDPRPRARGLGHPDARAEGTAAARRELEPTHPALGPASGEGRGGPQPE